MNFRLLIRIQNSHSLNLNLGCNRIGPDGHRQDGRAQHFPGLLEKNEIQHKVVVLT